MARPTQGRISLVETTSSGERKVEDDEDNFATPTSPREAVEVFEETVRPPPPAAAATPTEAAAATAEAPAAAAAAATLVLVAARGGDRASGPVSTDLPQIGASRGAVVARLSVEYVEWAVLVVARARLIRDEE